MLHDVIFLLLGLALIIAGGNYVTDGAVTVAQKLKVSSLVIGLTVVAFGSSAPDFVVCLTSTIQGKSQMALGDVVGSNIFDILLVTGIVAVIKPIHVSNEMVSKDLPMLALSSLALFFCGDDVLFDGTPDLISRTDGLLLLAFFIIFLCYTMEMAKDQRLAQAPASAAASSVNTTGSSGQTSSGDFAQTVGTAAVAGRKVKVPGKVHGQLGVAPEKDYADVSTRELWLAIAKIVLGLAALVIGGNWIVSGASGIALKAGMAEGLVGLTIVAFGSAAPDLATSLTAVLKNQPAIALGNLVGSCIINVYFCLGFCAVVHPLNAGFISIVDFSVLAGGSLMLWLFGCKWGHNVILRWEGALLILAYVAYLAYLIAQLYAN